MVPMAEESIDVPYWLLLSLKWLLAAGVTVGSAVGMHWIASKYRPGWARFCAAVPVLLAIHAVPLIFDPVVEPISVLAAAFLSCRLASGKVVALCMGRGALALPLTRAQFVSIMIFPVVPDAAAQGKPLQQLVSRTSVDIGDALQRMSSRLLNPRASLEKQGSTQLHSLLNPRASLEKQGSSQLQSVLSPFAGLAKQTSISLPRSPRASIDVAAVDGLRSRAARVPQPSPLMHAPSAPKAPKAVTIPTAPTQAPAANWLLHAAVVAAFALYCAATPDRMLAVARHLGGLWIMWQMYGGMMVMNRAMMHNLLDGLTLAPAFRNPFAATSLGDFWARRWNMTQSLVLKAWIYDPIVQGRLVAEPGDPGTAPPSSMNAAQRRRRRQIASAATFLVSGLEHELFHYYIAHSASPAWRWMAFFAVQAPLLMVEGEVKRFAKLQGLVLQPPVSSLATLMVLGTCAEALFWPPLCQDDLLAHVAEAARGSVAAFGALWQSAGMRAPPPPTCGVVGSGGFTAACMRLLVHPETYLPCCRGG